MRVQASGCRVQSSVFSVQGAVSSVQCSVFRVQGSGYRGLVSGCRIQGAGCRVHGAGFRVSRIMRTARSKLEGPNSKPMKREQVGCYRITSLIRNTPLLGPYSRTIPRILC